MVRLALGLAVGARFVLVLPLSYSMQGLALQKGNSNWVKKELDRVQNWQAFIEEDDDDFRAINEGTELLNLGLYAKFGRMIRGLKVAIAGNQFTHFLPLSG